MTTAAAVVFYKFKSSKDLVTLPIDGPFVSVSDLKTLIFASKRYGNGRDFDLLVSDAQTLEEYADDSILIRQNSSLLIRRIPGVPPLPIVVGGDPKPKPETESNSSMVKENQEDFDSHDFGQDFNPNPNPKALPSSIENPSNTHCKEGKIERGFTVSYPAPPPGYVCRRCKVAGHYIQHCPTNGDPSYDIVPRVRVKPTASSSASSCVTNNSNCNSVDNNIMILPELCCPLCKKLMRDAALTKCCFDSFCFDCIRDHIVANSACVCLKRIVLADDHIVPNKTLRDTIDRIMNQGGGDRSNTSGSSSVVQDFALSIGASKSDQETEAIIVPQLVHNSEEVKKVSATKEQENRKKKRKANSCQGGVDDSYWMMPAHCFPYGYGGYLQHNHIHGRDLSQPSHPSKKYKVAGIGGATLL